MRISRPCYDKIRRCPGWAGGGDRHVKADRCPAGGFLAYDIYDRKMWKFRFNQCPDCKVWVLPSTVRYLDWRFWKGELRFWWKYRR